MIHLIEVTAETTPEGLKKLSRKKAMTGGFELQLARHLSGEQLRELVERFSGVLAEYRMGTSEFRSSNAYRVLAQAIGHPEASAELRFFISEQLQLRDESCERADEQ